MDDLHDYSQLSDGRNADFASFNLIKPPNIHIKDPACLHVVHILQHPTSRPTRAPQDTMVNAPQRNLPRLPAGKFGKSRKQFTRWRHQANIAKSGLEAERVGALGSWHHLGSKKKLSAENRRETQFLSNEEKKKWIEDYVDRDTAVAW